MVPVYFRKIQDPYLTKKDRIRIRNPVFSVHECTVPAQYNKNTALIKCPWLILIWIFIFSSGKESTFKGLAPKIWYIGEGWPLYFTCVCSHDAAEAV